MENKENVKKKILINLALFIVVIIGMAIIVSNKVNAVEDKDFANLALADPRAFLSANYKNVGTVDLHIGATKNDATIWKSTAACVDPDHNQDDNLRGSYSIQAIIDIDNSLNRDLGNNWDGIDVYIPNGAVFDPNTHIHISDKDNAELVKRGRFLSSIANWVVYGNSGVQDSNRFTQSPQDDFLRRNLIVLCNNLGVKIMQGEMSESGWQVNYGTKYNYWTHKTEYYDYSAAYNEAKKYAEDRVNGIGGMEVKTDSEPELEYTATQTILGPYKVKITGSAKVKNVTIECSNRTYNATRDDGSSTGEITILDSSKNPIGLDSIPSEQNFYIRINDIPDEITNIKLTTSGMDVYSTRFLIFTGLDSGGDSNQRIAVFNNVVTKGNGELTLKKPTAKPILVAYKYIKSIQRLEETEGGTSYRRLFTVDEIPTLTVANQGTNNATVTNVQYPDYRRYVNTEGSDDDILDENGIPYVYDGDIVEFQWVIYNIGPGNSKPGTQYEITDTPSPGYTIQDGKENGWTESDGSYKKTITINTTLRGLKGTGTPNYYQGEDTMIYLQVVGQEKVDEDGNTSFMYNNNSVPTHYTWELSGIVFKDNIAQKNGNPDGILDEGDGRVPGIEVVLFDSDGKQIKQTTTDSNGYYEFKELDIEKRYYVRFKYNGQKYEPTTYNCTWKYTGVGDDTTTTLYEERSYATDGAENRDEFNNKFSPVDASHTYPSIDDVNNEQFMIYSYTGSNGMQNLTVYSSKDDKVLTQNVNFGMVDREQFDLNLRKDLVKVDVSINNKSQTYQYNGAGEDLDIKIRGTDVPDYNRNLRRTDLEYKAAEQYDQDSDKLQVYVTYKIQIKNQSVGTTTNIGQDGKIIEGQNGVQAITGYVLDLNDYMDDSYQLVNSYDENGKAINWSSSGDVSGNGRTYHKIHTTDLANEGITDKKWVFVQYKVSYDTLRQLLNNPGYTIEDNFAEIAGYRNTYTIDRYDLNGVKITNGGATAGLLDIDSTPDNMNPTTSEVQNFVAESKTEAYQNLGGEEKTSRSTAVFEDDADSAPGLRLICENIERTISGTVFEDNPLQDRLNNNERVGNGELEDGEYKVNQVHVELFCVENGDVNRLNDDVNAYKKIETWSDSKGNYTLSGYIPGDYYIKYTYGDETCIKAVQDSGHMYTGQDYKSTIYTEGNYTDSHWYQNTSPRSNDAADNYARRQTVNSYSQDLQYSNATILNATRDSDDATLKELADNTNMFATTASMSLEVEYLGQDNTAYNVQNIDFGIIERPRTKIVLEKDVAYVKLTATDGSTIFDSSETAPNLTWKGNEYDDRGNMTSHGIVQGTVDENLLRGASLTVGYTFRVTNSSERDYNEESYYYTGVIANSGTENTISAEKIIEYIPNALTYDAEETKANGGFSRSTYNEDNTAKSFYNDISGRNEMWEVVANKNTNKNISEEEYRGKLIEPNTFDQIKNSINQILTTTQTASDLGIKDTVTMSDVLRCTRVMSSPDESTTDDDMENIAEIIKVHIANGRRPYYEDTTNQKTVEIPGNANPVTFTNLEEVDTGRAEILTFVVPFGGNKQLTTIIVTIVSLAILVAGVVIIKKKVL